MHGRVAIALVIAAFAVGVGCGGADDSEETATAVTCPAAETNPENPFDAQTLVGQTVDAASEHEHGCTVRVTERDGEPLPATMDLQHNRIDVTVTDGKITAVSLS